MGISYFFYADFMPTFIVNNKYNTTAHRREKQQKLYFFHHTQHFLSKLVFELVSE